MRLWPTSVLTHDDWIAIIVLKDGRQCRIGVSPHLSEEQALAKVHEVLRWRRKAVEVVDISLKRRYQAFLSRSLMHPENQARMIK